MESLVDKLNCEKKVLSSSTNIAAKKFLDYKY